MVTKGIGKALDILASMRDPVMKKHYDKYIEDCLDNEEPLIRTGHLSPEFVFALSQGYRGSYKKFNENVRAKPFERKPVHAPQR